MRGELQSLIDILAAIAAGEPVSRQCAVGYTQARDALLASYLRGCLPGFLVQCSSAQLFRDFIELYHRESGARIAFIVAEFRECRRQLEPARPSSAFFDDDF